MCSHQHSTQLLNKLIVVVGRTEIQALRRDRESERSLARVVVVVVLVFSRGVANGISRVRDACSVILWYPLAPSAVPASPKAAHTTSPYPWWWSCMLLDGANFIEIVRCYGGINTLFIYNTAWYRRTLSKQLTFILISLCKSRSYFYADPDIKVNSSPIFKIKNLTWFNFVTLFSSNNLAVQTVFWKLSMSNRLSETKRI